MALPLVHCDLAEGLTAIEAVIRELFLSVEMREVGHGLVDQGSQSRPFHRSHGVRTDVSEVAPFGGKEFEFANAGSDTDKGSDVVDEPSVSLEDVVIGFFAGFVAPEHTVFESHCWERYAPVRWQDSDWTEVCWCGRSRSCYFM